MLTIQIPPADDGPNGTTGLPSALKSLATLTAAELQVRCENTRPCDSIHSAKEVMERC